MAPTLATLAANAACDAIVDLVDAGTGAGYVLIQDGNATVGNLAMSSTAFGAASNGTATANSITSDSDATAGTVDSFEIRDGDDTMIVEGSVTATGGGGDIELSTLSINNGDTIRLTSLKLGVPIS